MAENRTFKFMGNGFGTSNVSITAKINNTVIYSGEIPTIDLPPVPENMGQQVELFEIANSAVLNTDFAGSLPMTVIVTGGTGVNFGQIKSNFYEGIAPFNPTQTYQVGALCGYTDNNKYQCIQSCTGILPTDSAYWTMTGAYTPGAGTVDNFGLCYTGTPTNSESTPDTRSSVYIDGVQQVPPLEKSLGVWNWYVPAGSTLTYNWNIGIGQVDGVPGTGNAVANFA